RRESWRFGCLDRKEWIAEAPILRCPRFSERRQARAVEAQSGAERLEVRKIRPRLQYRIRRVARIDRQFHPFACRIPTQGHLAIATPDMGALQDGMEAIAISRVLPACNCVAVLDTHADDPVPRLVAAEHDYGIDLGPGETEDALSPRDRATRG